VKIKRARTGTTDIYIQGEEKIMIKHSENKKHNKTPMTKKKYAQCLHTDKILTIDSCM